jgi:hypothetical protein
MLRNTWEREENIEGIIGNIVRTPKPPKESQSLPLFPKRKRTWAFQSAY